MKITARRRTLAERNKIARGTEALESRGKKRGGGRSHDYTEQPFAA